MPSGTQEEPSLLCFTTRRHLRASPFEGRTPFASLQTGATQAGQGRSTSKKRSFEQGGAEEGAQLQLSSLDSSLEGSRRKARLHETFLSIDSHHKGFLDETDLRAYAKKHKLPEAYVQPFFEGVDSSHVHKLSFERFLAFVASRERGLQRAFSSLDKDGNGVLSLAELEAGLSSVCFTCPSTGNFHTCQEEGVRRLLATLPKSGKLGVTFSAFRDFFLLLPSEDLLVHYFIAARCPGKLDLGTSVPLALPDDSSQGRGTGKTSVWRHLTAGAAAGGQFSSPLSFCVRVVVRTLASLEKLTPLPGPANLSLALAKHLLQAILETKGWRGFWRGNLVNVLKSAPSKSLEFITFDFFKSLLSACFPGNPAAVFAAAGMAGATSCASLYPLEVVRSRVTVDRVGKYTGPLQAGHLILQTEGPAAFYRGLRPSLIAILPEASITYGLFDTLKRAHVAVKGKEAGVQATIAMGVFSAFIGQIVAFPLETVARRLQVAGPRVRKTYLGEARSLVRAGGVKALYRGVGTASLKVLPSALVSFGVYELLRQWMTELGEKEALRRALQTSARRRQLQGASGLPRQRRLAEATELAA